MIPRPQPAFLEVKLFRPKTGLLAMEPKLFCPFMQEIDRRHCMLLECNRKAGLERPAWMPEKSAKCNARLNATKPNPRNM
jgi:hypothetical protein